MIPGLPAASHRIPPGRGKVEVVRPGDRCPHMADRDGDRTGSERRPVEHCYTEHTRTWSQLLQTLGVQGGSGTTNCSGE